jgi:hypothetical protein
MLLQCDSKICTKCKQELPLTAFTRGPDRGYRYQCRKCNLEYQTKSRTRKGVANRYYARRKSNDPAIYMWKNAKHRAQWDYAGMEFTILPEDVVIPEVCPYLQVPFVPLDKRLSYSLDRIDSSKGYVKGNIQVISRLANKMKNDATKEELLLFAKGVISLYGDK